jgi:sucrose-6-phosphate hydrolase SacC (GH32 family)
VALVFADRVQETTTTSGTGSVTLMDIIYCSAKGMFVIVGSKSGTYAVIYTSTDGANWTLRTSNATANLRGVCWNGTKFVGVGSGDCVVSTDGITWTKIVPIGINNNKLFELR